MKKLTIILLCIVILCSMAGCQQDGTESEPKLLVGYGRADISPDAPMPMDGYGAKRISETVRDPLYATCIAVTAEDGTTMMVYSADLCLRVGMAIGKARKALKEQCGVEPGNVVISVTHTHFAPDPSVDPDENYNSKLYNEKLENALIQAGLDAWADRKPATLSYGSIEVTGLNNERHYIMDDGSVDAGGNTTGTVRIEPLSAADSQLQVVNFRRQGGKDVVMVNWQSHPQLYYWEGNGGGDTTVTADIVGATRAYVEKQIDCNFIYFTGASGNINPYNYAGSSIAATLDVYGEKLGRYVLMALTDTEELKVGSAQFLKKDNYYHNGTKSMSTSVFQLGELGFVCAPYEMFDNEGVYIKENSPYKHTFILTQADGYNSYFPSKAAYSYDPDGYEVNKGNPEGAAEELAQGYVAMLEELHKSLTGGGINE